MLTDTHCHLNSPEFDQDLKQVIQSARETGLKKILVPGIDLASSRRAVKLAETYPGFIYAAVGIHPNYATERDEDYMEDLLELLKNPLVVAVGEIGFDYYRDFSEKSIQAKTFGNMLDLAAESVKPVCIHQRESSQDIIDMLDTWYHHLLYTVSPLSKNPGVFHSFGGEDQILTWASAHNFYFGISGFITYKKAQGLRLIIKDLNKNRLLLETDAPYITPEPYRGRRNEPAFVQFTARRMSEELGISFEKVLEQTEQNAENLFMW